MNLAQPGAVAFVPDGRPLAEALARTTHLGVGAHADDLEIMAIEGILTCYRTPNRAFTGITVTDGAGTPRTGAYGDYSNEDMVAVRMREQIQAAQVGEYAAQFLLGYPSAAVKQAAPQPLLDELIAIFDAARPEIVYTHNLCDKHDTHVGVALRTIEALRALPPEARPKRLLGCEVWRDLDWLVDDDKVVMRCDAREGLQAALIGVFDSQNTGGKRYDLAALARRRAHATYHTSHESDAANALTFAMDLTPLLDDPARDPLEFAQEFVARLHEDVRARFARVGGQ